MHLLAREEVGLRCLVQVAQADAGGRPSGRPLTIPAIAAAEDVSPEYAAKLLRRLRLGGLVFSKRGAGGGYQLARPAAEISVWEALHVLDEAFLPEASCDCEPAARAGCRRTTQCAVQSLWRGVATQLRAVLENTSLQELCGADEAGASLPVVNAHGPSERGVPRW